MTHNVSEIQRRFIELGYLAAGEDDGTFGPVTLAAYNRFRASKGEPPHTGLLLLVEISADVFPEDAPPKPIKLPSIFDQLGTLLSLVQLLKGKTMTQDQINGILRAILTTAGGYFVQHGFVTGSVWDWITAGVLTIGPAIWSWISNRPKTIVPISAK